MHLSTKELILCALFIALITVGTFIKIPVGTDVYTLQFLFTLLAGLLLGPRLGAIAVGTYVVMGLVPGRARLNKSIFVACWKQILLVW